jgi:Uri superfamily endonuclease
MKWPARTSYVLILRVSRRKRISVGGLGALDLGPGFYAYVGSAFGAGGLAARLRHHLYSHARPHWHLDYLRGIAQPEEVWVGPEGARCEHAWASMLKDMPATTAPVRGFGSSDCRCEAHLFRFVRRPSVRSFSRLARARLSGNVRVRSYSLATQLF